MIFTPKEWYDMAAAAERLGRLPEVSGVAIKIATLDDPYYSRLRPRTYLAAAGLASPSHIAELVAVYGD